MVKWLFTESTFLEFESWLATFTYSQLFLDIAFTVQVEVIFLMCKLYLFYLRLTWYKLGSSIAQAILSYVAKDDKPFCLHLSSAGVRGVYSYATFKAEFLFHFVFLFLEILGINFTLFF